MAQLGTLLNTIACGADAVLGTGLKGCKIFFKKTTAIWLTPAGFEFDSTEEFNTTYLNTLKAQGNLIVVKGVRTFTDNSGDDVIDELEDGTKQVARLGLYEFMLNFVNGLYYHSALHSLNSFGNYDITFVDRDGNIMGTQAASGQLKGFTAGMIQGSKLSWATDSVGQREGIGFQLLERSELDLEWQLIQGSTLDFKPNQVEGINEVLLSFSAQPAAGTTTTVIAKRKQDGAPFVGLPAANWQVSINGSVETPTGDDSTTPGTYVLTHTAIVATDVITISTWDGTNNNVVITLSGDQYKSNILSGVTT